MVAAVDNFDELQHRAKGVPNGRKGLEFGCSPHVLDAAKLIKESWDAVTHKCDEQLRGLRDYRKQISRESISEMIDLLNNLKIRDPLDKAVVAIGLEPLPLTCLTKMFWDCGSYFKTAKFSSSRKPIIFLLKLINHLTRT
jgi:hypothetical protein